MANRFVRRIRRGDIQSVRELKSEFKELAKRTHPDLRGPGSRDGAEAEFVAARAEFEAALRDFEKHRFGARGVREEAERRRRDGGRSDADGALDADGPVSEEAWSCLSLLLKRGFPKTPRHQKELLRYEYARWRLEQALGGTGAALFGLFESDLLDRKAAGGKGLDSVLELLRDLIDYRYRGLTPMRTNVVLRLGRLRADPEVGEGARGFLDYLARDLDIGGEIG
jgi:curved DNA-binding protein CbpA